MANLSFSSVKALSATHSYGGVGGGVDGTISKAIIPFTTHRGQFYYLCKKTKKKKYKKKQKENIIKIIIKYCVGV